ncbi:MAG: hypothetical protein ABJB12_19975 [Pseudomonadota bacterium]
MRNGLAGSAALILVLTLPTAGCSSGSSSAASAGSGGASAGSGGASAGSGGASAGSGGASAGSGGASAGSGGASGGGECSMAGGADKVTALDGTKNLKDLTPTEAMQLCNDTNAYFSCLIGGADRCKWVGLRAAASTSPQSDMQMQSNCSHYEDSCHTGGAMQAGTECLNSVSSSCVGTVAQYSTCIRDETAAFNTTVKGFPACSGTKVSDISPINNAEGAMPPASCASLMNSCAPLEPPTPLTL